MTKFTEQPRPPRGSAWAAALGTASGGLLTTTPRVGVRASFVRFWPDTAPFRARLWISLGLVAVSPMLSTVAIWLFKVVIDNVVVPHDFHLFPVLAGAYVALAVVQGVVSFTDQYLSTWVGERFVLNLRTRLFAHLHQLSPGFFEQRPLGDILSRLTGDIGAIEELVLSGLAQALTYLCQLVFFTGALFYLDWRLAGASLIAAPSFLWAARFFSTRIKEASREKRRRAGAITTVAEESFSNAALVRAYDRTDAESTRFHEENLGSFTAQMLATRLQALFGPLSDLLEVIGVMLVLGLAVWELANNRITIGGVLVFVAYLTQLYGPVQGVGRLSNSLFAASASTERVIELLDETPLVTEPVRPTPLRRAHGAVRLRGVSFTYPGTEHPALGGIDLDVAVGEKIAVVGASGAGKSTLAKLLLRFYDPTLGAISIDGIDLRQLALSDLYRNVGTVLQETLVFDATIGDNIGWGKPHATKADIIAAATAADAHEFILALPQGYDTRVGQRGRMLSGGQRQRLAIARAMIRDAPILLLDEPTTGLDAESSQRVLAPLRRLMHGRTTIIISHNLLTVTDADHIVFLEHGRITGTGTHTQLLATNPAYAHLYRLHQPTTPADSVPSSLAPRQAILPTDSGRQGVPT
ncbi:MAG: ATP-binding cassette, subfamily bacterial [Pseudonocardiales bacterium]|jgi:ATP-binding cassette subfamily B protein|nr:ATP-binding cassette, subfamily bacterial [Pseudonocardiales bacterium]